MIRRLTIATVFAVVLGVAGSGAAAADGLPLDGSTSYGACVAIRPLDVGYCVSNPIPSLPDLP
jgi:hypothetical protein